MASSATTTTTSQPTSELVCVLPRVTVKYCTQCNWMLRAAYVSTSTNFSETPKLVLATVATVGRVQQKPPAIGGGPSAALFRILTFH